MMPPRKTEKFRCYPYVMYCQDCTKGLSSFWTINLRDYEEAARKWNAFNKLTTKERIEIISRLT